MKLSIITINLNNASGLQKTIESVVSQNFTDYEYIVIDGGSTDGSVEVIKQYVDKITYWVSEPDRGIYHAMNKGIEQAKGEYCLFLNSGDWILQHDGLQYVFDKNPAEDIFYCDAHLGEEKRIYPDRLTLLFFCESTITHQATFIKKSLFSIYGLYNEEYRIFSDRDFFLKSIIIGKCSYQHIPFFLIYYDINGISWSPLYRDIFEREQDKMIKELFVKEYELIQCIRELKKELNFYKLSKLIQFARKIQLSGFYQTIRSVLKVNSKISK